MMPGEHLREEGYFVEPIISQVKSDIKLNDNSVNDKLPAFSNDNLVIFEPDYLVTDSCNISSYHFVIPSGSMPELEVDNKMYTVGESKMFSTNPGQCLSNTSTMKVKPYIALFIEKSYMQNIARQSCGKSDIIFANTSSAVSCSLTYLINQFITEARHKQTGYKLILDSIAEQIAVLLIREKSNNLSLAYVERNCTENQNINQAVEYLIECYNEDVSLKELSRIANLSPYHFIRVFKEYMGKTPYQYLVDIKIKKSMELLKSSRFTITEISSMCGFANPAYFAVVFKKKTGVSPSYFRKTLAN